MAANPWDLKQDSEAQAFLQKQGAGLTRRRQDSVTKEGRKTNHYLVTDGANQDALVAALDKDWPGPLRHTILVAPGGQIVWRHNGPIDHDMARAAILAALKPY